jgi:hypothetical protein
MESIVVQVVGGLVIMETIKYFVAKYLKRADQDYVTTESCRKCEKYAEESADNTELREDLRAMKRLLFVLAEKQGIPAEHLRELIR